MSKRKDLTSRRLTMRKSPALLDRTTVQPRPPSASRGVFVRKIHNFESRQFAGGDDEDPISIPASTRKPSYVQSTSPMLGAYRDRTVSPFICENSPPKQLETKRFIRKHESPSRVNVLSRPQLNRVDLKKGSFSAKQIVGGRSIELSDSLLCDINNSRQTRPSKRSASPSFNTRNSKFYKLSRVFKISKDVLGCTSNKQKRTLSDSFKPEDFNLRTIANTPEPRSQVPCEQMLADLDDLARPMRQYWRARVVRL
jgi:hypothetical protein